MDAGRLQRLEEPARQAERDDVAVPALASTPGGEAQMAGIAQQLALQAAQQLCLGGLGVQILAAIDQAIAHPVLKRDAPLPPRLARGGAGEGIGLGRVGQGARGRDRAVAGQPLGIAVIAGAQRLFDQQAAKARAIDEQVTLDPPPVGQRHRLDIAVLGPQVHRVDPPLDPRHPAAFGITAQVAGIERGVEMKGVEQLADRRARVRLGTAKFAAARRHRAHRPFGDVRQRAAAAFAQPQLVEMHACKSWP